MQAQNIPTKQESTDQYAVGQLSHVGLVELAKARRDRRRRTDTIVPLATSTKVLCKQDMIVDLQSTNREHRDNHQAFFHAHVQLDEFGDWHRKNDAVESDVDDGMSPDKRVQIDAFSRMRTVPRGPDVSHRKTIDRNDHSKDHHAQRPQADKNMNSSTQPLAWEYAKIEEEESQLCGTNRDKPEDLCQPSVLHVND